MSPDDGWEVVVGGFDGVATLVHLARGGQIGESHETPHTVIADNVGGHLMQHGMVDMVVHRRDLAATLGRLIGLLLPRLAPELRAAGLHRVTVSIDSLDPEIFGRMNGLNVHPQKVLDGVEAALQAGLKVKINTVVQRGVNDGGLREFWLALRDLAPVRFIEFMDVGNHNGWNLESVVPSGEVLARLGEDFRPVNPQYRGEVAARHAGESGHEVGLISSVSAPFCGDCSRARLSAVGVLYTCLFAGQGTDLRAPLRAGATDDELRSTVSGVWARRRDRYSEERGEVTQARKVEMSHIGG